MGNVKTKPDKLWNYADYLTWPDDERWELIDGVAYAMSPAPGTRHQIVLRNLGRQFDNYLLGKPCVMIYSPFDVTLPERFGLTDEKVYTVVQPDMMVVCDRSKLGEHGCKGAPDLVVEITSPSTAKNDLTTKFELYERSGVREYWIIHPAECSLLVYKLNEDGSYGAPERYAADDKVPVPLFGDLVIDLAEVFAE